jgi:hydroxylaminobenzene mutase
MDRTLMKHGFVVFLLALLMGLPAPVLPHGRDWIAAHLTSMLNGLLLVAMGAAWSKLRLSERMQRLAFRLAILNGYTIIFTGVWSSVFGVPGPVSGAGAPPAPAWQMLVLGVGFFVVVMSSLVSVGLTAWGLRGAAPPAA